jgi:hypothetical protein
MAAFPNSVYLPAPRVYSPRSRSGSLPAYPRRAPAFPLILHGPNAVAVYKGLGVLSSSDSTIASAAASAASATGVLIGALATIPVAGPIAAAIAAVGVLLAQVFSGCGQTCTEASNLANQAEPLLLQNLNTYMSAPTHYASMQAAALNNFTLTWNALVSACSNPALGAAGQACISDRQQGGCHYKASPGGWVQNNGVWSYTPWGAEGSGTACWNWWVGYHDPIANDPTVVPDPGGAAGSLLSTVGINPDATIAGIPLGDLAIPALLILAAMLL